MTVFDGPVHKLGPHERAHYEAAKGLGCPGQVWYDKANNLYRWETRINTNLQGAIVNAAGYLAGGFDSDAALEDILVDCRRSKVTVESVFETARPYADRGQRYGAGPPEPPPTAGDRVRRRGRTSSATKKRGFFYWG